MRPPTMIVPPIASTPGSFASTTRPALIDQVPCIVLTALPSKTRGAFGPPAWISTLSVPVMGPLKLQGLLPMFNFSVKSRLMTGVAHVPIQLANSVSPLVTAKFLSPMVALGLRTTPDTSTIRRKLMARTTNGSPWSATTRRRTD